MSALFLRIESAVPARILRLISPDGTNRLTRACVLALTVALAELEKEIQPLVIAGNRQFFSVGADLNEIAALTLSGREA